MRYFLNNQRNPSLSPSFSFPLSLSFFPWLLNRSPELLCLFCIAVLYSVAGVPWEDKEKLNPLVDKLYLYAFYADWIGWSFCVCTCECLNCTFCHTPFSALILVNANHIYVFISISIFISIFCMKSKMLHPPCLVGFRGKLSLKCNACSNAHK